MGLMMLAAAPGTQIGVSATGKQAEQAVEAIAALVKAGFDED
jgi:phosphocarrier protein